MTVLVTGGAGFIGSHLCEHLLSQGHSVVCLDNFDSFYAPEMKRANISGLTASGLFTLVEADIRDDKSLDRTLGEHPIDVVVHLAARAGVRPSLLEPHVYYDVNVIGTQRILDAMRRAGVSKLVFGSSSSVYGDNVEAPFKETAVVDHPISPYAASKKAAELACHTYHHLHGLDVFCLRFFTAYGPRQRPDMGIFQFLRKVALGEPITLFGDGSSRRDYTYVGDIVEGVGQAVSGVKGWEIINLGESHTVTLLDLIRTIERVVCRKATIRWEPMQPGDVLSTMADIDKARILLGYLPRMDIHAGLGMMFDWMRSQGLLK